MRNSSQTSIPDDRYWMQGVVRIQAQQAWMDASAQPVTSARALQRAGRHGPNGASPAAQPQRVLVQEAYRRFLLPTGWEHLIKCGGC